MEFKTAVTETNIWQLLDVLKEATRYLSEQGIENPRLNAEMLLSHLLGVQRIDLYLRFEQPLNSTERQNFKVLLHRRVQGEPLQYILSETEFFSLPFSVTADVLIPRPETELLVEASIQLIKRKWCSASVRCLDIGTGSGNIAVAIAKNLPNAKILGVDVSEKAIVIAKRNAEKNNVADRTSFLVADVLKPDFVQKVNPPHDVICANPPYIATHDLERLPKEIRNFEPLIALDGGYENGLKFYRRFAEIFPTMLRTASVIFLEIGETQAQSVQNIFSQIPGFKTQIKKDLSHKDRLLIGEYEKPG